MITDPAPDPFPLPLSLETLAYIVVKAREYDVKVEPVEQDPGSNASDDGMSAILSDYANDPTVLELKTALDTLGQEEKISLLAIVWVGRGDYDRDGWAEALDAAQEACNQNFTNYLMGVPLLGDYIEQGLEILGHSLAEDYRRHL